MALKVLGWKPTKNAESLLLFLLRTKHNQSYGANRDRDIRPKADNQININWMTEYCLPFDRINRKQDDRIYHVKIDYMSIWTEY